MLYSLPNPKPNAEAFIATVRSRGPKNHVPQFEFYTAPAPLETILQEPLELDDTKRFMGKLVKYFYQLGYDYIPVGVRHKQSAQATSYAWVQGAEANPVESWEKFEQYPWAQFEEASFEEFEVVRKILPEGMTVLGAHHGIFETILGILGYENLFFAIHDQPEILRAAIDRIGAYKLRVFQTIAAVDAVGVMSMGDDLGSTQGLMVSPEFLRATLWPWYRKIFQTAHAAGKPMILHSCGKIYDVMDELIEDIGIDAKHSFEETAMPVEDAYDRYGDRIAIMGGVAADAMARMPVAEFRVYARSVIEHCAGRGNYCFGSGSGILNYTKIENFLALLEIGREYQTHA
ncbi:MAG: hypothetical protein HY360_03800 [Verrucomicrobia bacterium]|nr:hypothetical protein [Verrucomicrobiota bacterium]